MPSSNQNKPQHAIKARVAERIVSARLLIISFFAVAFVAAIYCSQLFRIDASADTLLVKNNALYIRSQQAARTFSPEEFVLLAYKPKNHELFSDQTFTDLVSLKEQIKQIERVKNVTSILNVPLIDADSSLLFNDVAALTWEQQQFSAERMQQLLDQHPIFTDLLVNKDQTAVALQITFNENDQLKRIENEILDIQQLTLSRALTEKEQTTIEQLKAQADPIKQRLVKTRQQEIETLSEITQEYQSVDTYLGGSYVVGYHLVNIIQSDLTVFGIAITIAIGALLFMFYRNFTWIVFPLLMCAISAVLTIGLFGFLDLRTTVISANFIALQLILTLAVMIHLIGAYRSNTKSNAPESQRKRVEQMLAAKLAPCFYATITTSVGFGSLVFSGIQPVNDFGMMMLIAMLITMSVSLLLFPALLSYCGSIQNNKDFTLVTTAMQKLAILTANNPIKTIVVSIFVFVGLGLGVLKLTVENSFINYFDDNTTIYQELAFIDKEFGGSTPLDIIITLPKAETKSDLVITAENVASLQIAQEVTNAYDATGSITSIVNFTELAKQVNNDKPLTEYELDALYSMLDESVAKQLLGAYLDDDSAQFRIATRIQDTTEGLNRQEFLDTLHDDLDLAGINEDQYVLTNLFVLYQDILSRLLDSQIKTLGIVYAALALALLLIFRSVKIALIALIPNIFTTLGVLGVIGWLGIPLDLMTITIAAIAMGIAMDDTIHFVDSALKYKADNSMQKAFNESGIAIFYTSIMIAVGFSLFMFSDFLPSVYFGVLTATAMLLALICDLTLLPALLKRFVIAREPTSTQSLSVSKT